MTNTIETAENEIIENQPILIAHDVSKWFGKFQVLRNANLQVKAGEVVVIMGPSGSGKSTFIRTFNALEPYQEGRITIDGIPLTEDIQNIDQILRDVGMVFQQYWKEKLSCSRYLVADRNWWNYAFWTWKFLSYESHARWLSIAGNTTHFT